MRDLQAIFREPQDTGPAVQAYEDLRDWAIDEFQPLASKQIRKKVRSLAAAYGVKEGTILRLLGNPPGHEPRPDLMAFLYDTIFFRR